MLPWQERIGDKKDPWCTACQVVSLKILQASRFSISLSPVLHMYVSVYCQSETPISSPNPEHILHFQESAANLGIQILRYSGYLKTEHMLHFHTGNSPKQSNCIRTHKTKGPSPQSDDHLSHWELFIVLRHRPVLPERSLLPVPWMHSYAAPIP